MNPFQAITAASSMSSAPTTSSGGNSNAFPGTSWADGGAALKDIVSSPVAATPPSTHTIFAPAVGGGGGKQTGNVDKEQVFQWIQELTSPSTREHALIELSRKREVLPDLAPMLWHSLGTMAALLQEIVLIYPVINPPTLTAQQSNRVCNALALLQCVASHPETRTAFLNAHIPLFLYPFLHTVSKSRPFEYLRLTSLGVVGALVKTDEQDVINFLLTTEIIPLCLRIMESGSELSKTVATFILQKILLDETGLSYICQTFERFSHVSTVLGVLITQSDYYSHSRPKWYRPCLMNHHHDS
jgi:CCR4-NOT transcription complex subunit 9